jgi:HEAT repeat protein
MSCFHADSLEDREWYRQAQQFILFEEKSRQLAETDGDYDALDLLTEREERQEKFLETVPPLEDEIISLLTSNSDNQKSVGLVSIYLSGKLNPKFIPYLFTILGNSNNFTVKTYTLMLLDSSPQQYLDKYESNIHNYALNEQDPLFAAQTVSLLIKLTPDKSAQTMMRLLERDHPYVRNIAFTYLGKLGEHYQEKAIAHITKTRNIDKEDFFKKYLDISVE